MDLQKKLEDWIAPNPKIKLLRHKEREGLIRARLTGAKAAVGEVWWEGLIRTNLSCGMCGRTVYLPEMNQLLHV